MSDKVLTSREQALLLGLMEMVIQGVSTRRVSEITERLCGSSFSKSTISHLCKRLDPLVEAFRNRPLEKRYPFVTLDAIYMRARDRGAVRSKGMLIGIGINEAGTREILGFVVGDGESYEAWNEFIGSLRARGLREVDLVTSDQHAGLRQAIKEQFSEAVWKRCQTHFSRNVLYSVPKRERKAVQSQLVDLYNSPNLEAAYERKERLMRKLGEKAAKKLDEGFDDITAVFGLPEPNRKRLRTSNSIERLNEEIRRRERVIPIFPNERSIVRLIGTLLMEQHEKWAVSKAFFNMETYREEKREAKVKAEAVRKKLPLENLHQHSGLDKSSLKVRTR